MIDDRDERRKAYENVAWERMLRIARQAANGTLPPSDDNSEEEEEDE